MTGRRKLLFLLGASALLSPFGVRAQTKIARVGVLSVYTPGKDPQFDAFKHQLRELGYVEGKTISIEYLSSEGTYERLPALAAELIKRKVEVIAAISGTPPAAAARNAAPTIPVVFSGVGDPVGQNLVNSLARPGGNITGISNQHPETGVKFLTLLREMVPAARKIAVLTNPTNSSLPLVLAEMQAAARKLRVELFVVNAKGRAEFENAFAEIVRERPAGLVIFADPLFNNESARLAQLAAKHRLPTMGGINLLPESGGLMSYGADRIELIRRAAVLVDKVLKGANPADLPVEQPTKFDLVLNKRTAQELGLKVPKSILSQATAVIE